MHKKSYNRTTYSDLPNNHAANLIIFLEKNTYTSLLGPTRLLISDIFPSKPDFHLYKREKIIPTRLLISEKSATYTIK